jgi:hypothetical protein
VLEQLESYPATDPIWLGNEVPAIDGWEAYLAFVAELAPFRTAAAA